MAQIIKEIFNIIQHTRTNHQKYKMQLVQHFKKTNFEEFCNEFWCCLRLVFKTNINDIISNVHNVLNFAANFCMDLAQTSNDNNKIEDDADMHPFIIRIVSNVLNCSDCFFISERYFACKFFALLFNCAGDNISMDENMCNKIEEALLLRMNDKIHHIRVQAVAALFKLQNPNDGSCKILKAYIQLLSDPSALVRKEIVKQIAPCKKTLPYICMKVRDKDKYVRVAAFEKCAGINPKYLKFNERLSILASGFQEEVEVVKKKFLNVLIPKWISAYDENFLKLLNALKLDADDNDFENSDYIFKNLMNIIFKKYPVIDIINVLPIEENHLIPYEKLNSETINYWNLIINHLQDSNEDDCLQKIIPDLSSLCDYIRRFINNETDTNPATWRNIEKEHILKYLLETLLFCDFNEEAGRQCLKSLMSHLLLEHKHNQCITMQIVNIFDKMHNSLENLSDEIFGIVNKFQSVVTRKDCMAQENFPYEISRLNCQLNRLETELEEAITNNDLAAAAKFQDEIENVKKVIAEMNSNHMIQSKNLNVDCIEQCLLIIISFLKLPSLKELPKPVIEFKEKYVMPLMNKNNKLYKTAFELIVLCSLLDKKTAEEHLQLITIPLITYQLISDYEKDTLNLSIKGTTDLILLYGPDIFINETSSQKLPRTFYQTNNIDEALNDFDSVNANVIVEIMVDILDDDDKDVSKCAGMALLRLILHDVAISHNLIARIILKWFNPVSEIDDSALHQYIGMALFEYASNSQNSESVFEKCVLPLLITIAKAPKNSPLSGIDVPNLIKFLSTITKMSSKTNNFLIHKNLSHKILHELLLNPNSDEAVLFSKMLLNLEIPYNDTDTLKEIKEHVEKILSVINDNSLKINLQRYHKKLNNCNYIESVTEEQSLQNNSNEHVETERSINEAVNEIENKSTENEIQETDLSNDEVRPKRRKYTKQRAKTNGLTIQTRRSNVSINNIDESKKSNTSKKRNAKVNDEVINKKANKENTDENKNKRNNTRKSNGDRTAEVTNQNFEQTRYNTRRSSNHSSQNLSDENSSASSNSKKRIRGRKKFNGNSESENRAVSDNSQNSKRSGKSNDSPDIIEDSTDTDASSIKIRRSKRRKCT